MQEFEKQFLEILNQSLLQAQMELPVKKYFQDSVKYSVLCSLSFWIFWSIVVGDLVFGILFSIIFFAINLCCWMYYPFLRKKKKAQLVEKELAFALMGLGIELSVETRFERALKNVAQKNQNELGKELLIVLKQIEQGGATLQEALIGMLSRTDSLALKRAVMKIITIYEQGGTKKKKAFAIKSIAKEELSIQRSKSKEYSQKLVFFSLLFIVVSAVFPALFLAFIIVGASFMELDFSAIQIIAVVTLVFPLVDVGALFYIRSTTPYFLR